MEVAVLKVYSITREKVVGTLGIMEAMHREVGFTMQHLIGQFPQFCKACAAYAELRDVIDANDIEPAVAGTYDEEAAGPTLAEMEQETWEADGKSLETGEDDDAAGDEPAEARDANGPGKEWPRPNGNGVYSEARPDRKMEFRDGKVHLLGLLLEVRPGVWAEGHKAGGNDWGNQSPLCVSRIGPTTLEAAARRLLHRFHELIERQELGRKAKAWLAETAYQYQMRLPGLPAPARNGSKQLSTGRDPFDGDTTVDERRARLRNWNLAMCEGALRNVDLVANGIQPSILAALKARIKQLEKTAR